MQPLNNNAELINILVEISKLERRIEAYTATAQPSHIKDSLDLVVDRLSRTGMLISASVATKALRPKWRVNDGGRAAAGYQGVTGDCATRAIAIATGMGYQEVYDLVNTFCAKERKSKRRTRKSSARTGVHHATMRRIMQALGWQWVPTMQIGAGCTVHVKASELPAGAIVLSLSKHYAAMVDGVLEDTYDSSRDGTRCVYGYWKKESINE